MQKSLLFLFFGIVLCDKVVDKPRYLWNQEDDVRTGRFNEILISVETQKLDVEISDPTVSVILPRAFEKSKQIEFLTLNLMKGPIIFGKNSFEELKDLRKLYFGDSLITLYDDTFEYTQNLELIHMRLSEFTTEITNKFDTLPYLTELRIKNGHLVKIKAYTFNINENNMEILELSSCSIFSIEARAFVSLINLVTLDLSNNTLMRITPDTFKGLSKLKTLNLTNNNLYKIGEAAFNGLVQLVTLDISYNDLIEIASTAFHNLEIGGFILNNNRFKKIAKELFNYPISSTIHEIYLQNNWIDRIEDGALAGLDIMILNLTGNNLEFIGNKMFEGCKGISQLDLSGNPIQGIPNNPFNNCKINEISFFIDDKKSLEYLVSKNISGSIEIKWRQ